MRPGLRLRPEKGDVRFDFVKRRWKVFHWPWEERKPVMSFFWKTVVVVGAVGLGMALESARRRLGIRSLRGVRNLRPELTITRGRARLRLHGVGGRNGRRGVRKAVRRQRARVGV